MPASHLKGWLDQGKGEPQNALLQHSPLGCIHSLEMENESDLCPSQGTVLSLQYQEVTANNLKEHLMCEKLLMLQN